MASRGRLIAGLVALGGLVMFLMSPAGAAVVSRRLSKAEVRALAIEATQHFPAIDPVMLQAIAEIESSRLVRAFRNEPQIGDASAGLMQTLLGTAQWVWDTGFHGMGARPEAYETLFDPRVSMYYAAGFLNMLRTWGGQSRSEEFMVRAYNGGPGNAAGAATAPYWQKYLNAKSQIGG